MGSSKNEILWQKPLLHLQSSAAKKLLGIVGLAKRSNEKLMERLKPFWVTSDRNERKQTQVQMLRSNTGVKVILNGISDPLMILGGDFSVKILNRAAAKYYRVCKPGDVIGRRCHETLRRRQSWVLSGAVSADEEFKLSSLRRQP